MKNKIVLFLIFLTTSFACLDSNNEEDETGNEITIVGKWEWVKSTGGIDGRTDTPTSTNKTIVLNISASTIDKIANDVIEKSEKYSLIIEESIFGGQRIMIFYENGFKKSLEKKGNQLILSDECFDCFQHIYNKKQ